MTLAARFEEWALQSEQKGRKEGEARILRRFLVARFGPLGTTVLEQLEQASTEQIEAWFDRALTANNLNDIFRK